MKEALLEIHDLKTWFDAGTGRIRAVDGVDFSIQQGETFALLGESGCGKSMTALSIMRLLPESAKNNVSGHIKMDGEDLLLLPEVAMRKIRGNRVAMIFQEPMTSLNPVLTVETQIVEVLERHTGVSREDAKGKAVELLVAVGIPDPMKRVKEYPHQLSGGMQQRASLCRALITDPQLLLMDEPFGALDAMTRDELDMELLRIWEERKKTVLFVTHSIQEAVFLSDRVFVMSARPGRLIEILTIDRPRPRTMEMMSSPQFGEYTLKIRGMFASANGNIASAIGSTT